MNMGNQFTCFAVRGKARAVGGAIKPGDWSMAQVKIYGLQQSLAQHRSALSAAIHETLMEVFALPAEKRFQRFIALDAENFLFPPDRSDDYTIIEISCFEGRAPETKRRLITTLFDRIAARAGIQPQDVEITIFETPQANWGIRGKPGDELALNYKVSV
jgi:phenylpyruvate tautomerase PptA (4-oxalocrotonate tautomerase family)